MKKIVSAMLALVMLFSLLTVSAGAVRAANDNLGTNDYFVDSGPDNPDYLHDLVVNLPVANSWSDSQWVCEFNGTGTDMYIYAVAGPESAHYNLGYSVGGSGNITGWHPNLTVGQDGIVIHTETTGIYEIRASVPEGTGGEFNIVISRKPIDLTWSEGIPFTDVPANYLSTVLYAYANGLMTGTSSTTFSPDNTINRAMMWTILARMNGVAVEPGTPWYAPAQAWAVSSGLSDGTAPERELTLQETITVLYRQAESPAASGQVNVDKDGQTADWARDAMAWALSANIISGGNPAGTVSRAELAEILLHYGLVM